MTSKRIASQLYKPNSSNSTDEWIKAWEKSEDCGKQYNNGFLDQSYRTSSQKIDKPISKRPIPIPEISDKSQIKEWVQCAKYAVWNKVENYYIALPCKKWTCPVCSKKNEQILIRRLGASEINSWGIKRHVILTVADDATLSNLSELINDFMKDLRRNGFSRIKYLWVKEFQYERFLKYGVWWRHIHMMVNMDITEFDIIPYWNKHNKNKFNMIKVTKVRNFNKGSYMTKYFTKEEHQKVFDKGERRYGSSRGVLLPIIKKPSLGIWEFMPIEEARNLHDFYQKYPNQDISWIKDEGVT